MGSLPRPILAIAAAASLALCACPGPTTQKPAVSARPAAEWVGTEATLFDDGIDVGAVPSAPEVEPPRDETNDAMIGQRLRDADGVVVAKVIGVTREPVGDGMRFVVELAVDGAPIAGKAPPPPLVLRIGSASPAFGTVRAREQEIVGRKLIVYYQRYATADGQDAIVHFHLSAATAGLLGDVKKQAENLNGF